MTRSKIRHTPEAFLEANGLVLCHDSFGDRADPAVVLVMGMGAQMVGWDDEFCEQLAERGFWVIRFDNRDAGKSSRFDDAGVPDVAAAMTRAWLGQPVKATYLLQDMAADVVGLLDALSIEMAHVVGASMGGGIGQLLAIHHPDRIITLTSLMSTTGERGLPPPQPAALAALFKPPARTLDDYIEDYVESMAVLRAGEFPEEEERDRARAERNHARGLYPAGAARQLVAILASGGRKEALRSVVVPSLVIHGDLDPLVSHVAGVDTARSIPGAELITLEGMGHTLPVRMWPRIIDAVARHALRGTTQRLIARR